MWHKIKCPCCGGGEISMNIQVLATGEKFPCSSCGAVVSIAGESQEFVKHGVNGFMEMQKKSVGFNPQPENTAPQ